MEPTKSQNNMRAKALEISDDIANCIKDKVQGYGNLCDQLRVTGYVAQALMDFAEGNLTRLKFEHDDEVKKMIKVYQ